MLHLWIPLVTTILFYGVTCAVEHTLIMATPSPGYIVSQDWPMNYPHNHKRLWTLTSFDPNYIVIAQAIAVHIEQDSSCRWDYVQVYDGAFTQRNSMGRFCGFSRPWFASTDQNMTISFQTDSTRSYAGFKIKYWCNLKPGVKVKDIYSERDNIIAVILASMMIVTISYLSIITCCRGSHGRHWGMLPLRATVTTETYSDTKQDEDLVLIDLDKQGI